MAIQEFIRRIRSSFHWGSDLTLLSRKGAPLGHTIWFYGITIPWTEIALGIVVREKRVRGASYCVAHGGYGFTSDCVDCGPTYGVYSERQQDLDRAAAIALDLGEEERLP